MGSWPDSEETPALGLDRKQQAGVGLGVMEEPLSLSPVGRGPHEEGFIAAVLQGQGI